MIILKQKLRNKIIYKFIADMTTFIDTYFISITPFYISNDHSKLANIL